MNIEKEKVVIDTSAFVNSLQAINKHFDEYDWVLTTIVEEELDNLSKSKDEDKAFKARQALRFIEQHEDDFIYVVNEQPSDKLPIGWDRDKNDNLIIDVAINLEATIFAYDRAMVSKARTLGLKHIQFPIDNELERYTGIKEIYLDLTKEEDKELLSAIYEGRTTLDTEINQYLLCWDKETEQSVGEFKNKDGKLIRISPKPLKSRHLGEIKPLNIKQRFAFDLLGDTDIKVKVLNGGFGTGKTLLATAYALQELQKGNFQKIVYLRNNHEVKGTKEIGFLPDGELNKLLPFAMPIVDYLGGIDALTMLVNRGEIEIVHMGFLRGRNFENSIIMVNESQNLTNEHMKLILGRAGQGSVVIFDGDLQQVDDIMFKNKNGLVITANALKGNPLYGQVTLDKVERSNVAELADKISQFEKGMKI